MDAFQGCYKDGTNGTRDCHYLALFPLAFSFIEELIMSTFLSFIASVLYITLFVIAQPYKDTVYNKRDIPLLMALLFGPVALYVDIICLKKLSSDLKGFILQ